MLKLVKLGSILHVLPLQVNFSRSTITQGGAFRNTVWHLILFAYCLDLCYLTCVANRVTLKKFSETEFVNFYLHFISRLTAGVLAITLVFLQNSLIQFYNILIQTQRQFLGMNSKS